MANPNSATFPTAVATDADLLVVKDNAYSTVATGGVDGVATSITFDDATAFEVPCLIALEDEVVLAAGPVSGNTIQNCERGFRGSATSHAAGVIGFGYLFDWYINQLAAEIKAIETALGANLVNVIKNNATAGGDLSGTYPNPTVAKVGATTSASIASAASKAHDQNTDTGTNSATFQIGAGNKLKSSGTVTEVRNAADDAYSDFKAKTVSTTSNLGGDLTGTLPNPSLATVGGLTPGQYGTASDVAVVTVDAKGRVTSVSTVSIDKNGGDPGGTAGGDLGGTYPNPTVETVGGKTKTEIANAVTTVGTTLGGDLGGTLPNPTVTWPNHPKIGGSAPTIAADTGAGTSPTIAIAGKDSAGKITLTPGTTPAVDATVATITFNTAYSAAPTVILTPGNKAAMNLTVDKQVFVSATSTTTFTVTSNGVALAESTEYVWYFVTIG